MALHRLTSVTVGVPDVDAAAAFYRDFGLDDRGDGRFATTDGGEQLHLVAAPRRGLHELGLGADDADDLDAADAGARRARRRPPPAPATRCTPPSRPPAPRRVTVAPSGSTEPHAGRRGQHARVAVDGPARGPTPSSATEPVRPRRARPRRPRLTRRGRDPTVLHRRPRLQGERRDPGVGAFLRCSTDHHNLLVQARARPFLHHTSWQVDDVDEVGRGATRCSTPTRPATCGASGRHHIGSNFFWYLSDPAGNFAEYYSDLDVIVDDELWQPDDSPTCGPYVVGPAGAAVVHRPRRPRGPHGTRLVVSVTTVSLTGTGVPIAHPATAGPAPAVRCGPIRSAVRRRPGHHPPPRRGGRAAAGPDRGVRHPPALRPPHRVGRRRVDPVADAGRCAAAYRRAAVGEAHASSSGCSTCGRTTSPSAWPTPGRTDRPCYEVVDFEAAVDPHGRSGPRARLMSPPWPSTTSR